MKNSKVEIISFSHLIIILNSCQWDFSSSVSSLLCEAKRDEVKIFEDIEYYQNNHQYIRTIVRVAYHHATGLIVFRNRSYDSGRVGEDRWDTIESFYVLQNRK